VSHGGGKRCQEQGCLTLADKTGFCYKHGGGKLCKENVCKTPSRGKFDYCVAHGGGKRCPNCIDWIDSRGGNKKYDGYCATCFQQLFPTDKRSIKIRQKGSEVAVQNFLNTCSNLNFIHDLPIFTAHCDCTHRRRIDFRQIIDGTMLCIEVDERQHKNYKFPDEEDRYDDLYMVYSGKWIFIRFNPDSFVDHSGKRKNPEIKKRFPALLDEIEKQRIRIRQGDNTELIEVTKLFFDAI
jgi:hypothetical protein